MVEFPNTAYQHPHDTASLCRLPSPLSAQPAKHFHRKTSGLTESLSQLLRRTPAPPYATAEHTETSEDETTCSKS